MANAPKKLRPKAAPKKRKLVTTRKLSASDHTLRDPRSEPVIEQVVRLNQTYRRRSLGLNQRQLAAALQVSQAFVCYLERPGRIQTPSLELLAKLATALSCTPADLLTPGKFSRPKGMP